MGVLRKAVLAGIFVIGLARLSYASPITITGNFGAYGSGVQVLEHSISLSLDLNVTSNPIALISVRSNQNVGFRAWFGRLSDGTSAVSCTYNCREFGSFAYASSDISLSPSTLWVNFADGTVLEIIDGYGGCFTHNGYKTVMETYTFRITQDARVPEPASLALLATGLLGLGFVSRGRWREEL